MKMSLLDNLPLELQEVIYNAKFELETKNLQAFVDDFDMKIISTRKMKESKDMFGHNHIIRYKHKVHLTYKPTRKSMIVPYTHGVFANNDIGIPSKYDVVQSLSLDAYYFHEGDWTHVQNKQGEWVQDFSYQNYESNSDHGLSLATFILWKNIVKKLELILQERFDKFSQYCD